MGSSVLVLRACSGYGGDRDSLYLGMGQDRGEQMPSEQSRSFNTSSKSIQVKKGGCCGSAAAPQGRAKWENDGLSNQVRQVSNSVSCISP